MPRGRPVTDEQRARIRALHAQGKGRNQIAAELGMSAGSVTKVCAEMGLSFERTAVAAATEARVIDLKARRAALVDRGYRRVEHLYERLEAPMFRTLVRTEGGGEAPDSLGFVPTQAERDLAQAISTHLTSAAKLEAVDSDDGASDARSMLAKLGAALGIGSTDGV